MQDNAPMFSSTIRVMELYERGISAIEWPPCSDDLISIESIRYKMEYLIQDKYPDLGE